MWCYMTKNDVIFKVANNIGWIVLNRADKHNAISHSMVKKLYEKIIAWELNKDIYFIVIEGAGHKAFSAGGDVKSLYSLKGTDELIKEVYESFTLEYSMDIRLHKFSKPIITYMNGITMGGGVGIGVTGTHRIVNENTKWAMPEVDIGLFPDVGASYFLNNAPGCIGKYLALTGKVLKGEDVVACRLADYIIDSKDWPQLKLDLLDREWNIESCNDSLSDLIGQYRKKRERPSYIRNHYDVINEHFDYESMEEILESLFNSRNWGDAWAKEHLTKLLNKSPTSLKVVLKQIEQGRHLSIEDCFKMELTLALNFMRSHDFFEGVRAVLVDKDRKPNWRPSTINSVSNESVREYFIYDYKGLEPFEKI